MPFLVKRGRHAELQRILARMEPGYRAHDGDRFGLPQADRAQGAPIGQLFQDGRAFSTIMFWVAFFMCLFMVYALSSWLAKLMAGAGYSLGSALSFVLVLNFGTMLGAIAIPAVIAAIAAIAVGLISHRHSASSTQGSAAKVLAGPSEA